MAAAFGMGFIGFIFAAYSYNQQNKEDIYDVSSNLEDSDKSKYNSIDNTEENTNHLENNSIIDKTKKHWGKFWKGEYKNMRSEEEEKINK